MKVLQHKIIESIKRSKGTSDIWAADGTRDSSSKEAKTMVSETIPPAMVVIGCCSLYGTRAPLTRAAVKASETLEYMSGRCAKVVKERSS